MIKNKNDISQEKYKEEKQKEELKINKYNQDNNSLIDKIQTITYDLDTATFFQCGICMDSFHESEELKMLPCDHIFHVDCMNQWIQNNKTCPFCEQAIFY